MIQTCVFGVQSIQKLHYKRIDQAQRAKNLAYQHNLVLTCTHNKIQLLYIIANYITKKVLDDAFRYIFIVTSYQDVSIQVSDGSITLKEDYWI